MRRVLTLSWFLTKDFFRSWQSFVPPAIALTFYAIAFQYGGTPTYFAGVTGAALIFICVVTVLLLSSRLNRASTYPLLARLAHRTELLASIALTAFVLTMLLAALLSLLVTLQNAVTLQPAQWLRLLIAWPLLVALASLFGLHLTGLVSKGGSHLAAYALVALLAAVYDYRFELTQAQLTWVVQAWQRALWPISETLSPFTTQQFTRAGLMVGLYAVFFFLLAALLFGDKDLLWSE